MAPPSKKRAPAKSKNKGAPNIHLFLGTDGGKAKELALQKFRQLSQDVDPQFGLEEISGISENSDTAEAICNQARSAVLTLPFLGGKKVIWVKGANFLGDNQTGRSTQTQEAWARLVAALEDLPPEVEFILHGDKPDRRRASWKALEKIAKPQLIDLPDASRDGWQMDVSQRAQQRASELGFHFEHNALELFVHLTGEDSRTVDSEIEKLGLYLQAGESADIATIKTLVPTSRAGVIFELGDAIGRRRLGSALDALNHFTQRNENPVGLLLAAIAPKVRNLLVASELNQRHNLPDRSYPSFQSALDRLPKSETSHLPRAKTGKINAYPLYLSLREAKNFTSQELRTGLKACLDANRRLVTTRDEPVGVLIELLSSLCRRPPTRK